MTWVDSSKIKRNIMKYSDKVLFFFGGWADFSLMILICFELRFLARFV